MFSRSFIVARNEILIVLGLRFAVSSMHGCGIEGTLHGVRCSDAISNHLGTQVLDAARASNVRRAIGCFTDKSSLDSEARKLSAWCWSFVKEVGGACGEANCARMVWFRRGVLSRCFRGFWWRRAGINRQCVQIVRFLFGSLKGEGGKRRYAGEEDRAAHC